MAALWILWLLVLAAEPTHLASIAKRQVENAVDDVVPDPVLAYEPQTRLSERMDPRRLLVTGGYGYGDIGGYGGYGLLSPSPSTVPEVNNSDPCFPCLKCINDMQAFVFNLTLTFNANMAAAANATYGNVTLATVQAGSKNFVPAAFIASDAFQHMCIASGRDAAKCILLAVDISQSLDGNLARRPGALCTRLNECIPKQPCNLTVTNNGSLAPLALDTCTATGLVGGPPVGAHAQAIALNASCGADTDCSAAAGEVCNTGIGGNIKVCTCVDGVDFCSWRGICSSFCATQASYIATRNSLVHTCTIANASGCSSSEVCVASSQCFQVTCSGATISTTDCAAGQGLCVPAVRKPLTASLNAAGNSIFVQLNAPARPATFACSQLFNAAATALVGAEALCTADGYSLVVLLTAAATVLPGDNLTLSATQSVLSDALVPALFSGSISVGGCSGACQPAAPSVVLMAPAVLSKPCSANETLDVTLDARLSSDPSGRPITSFRWAYQAAANDSMLDAILTAANAQTLASNQAVLAIASADLAAINPGVYALTVTATNFLGTTVSATRRITVATAGAAPVISIVGPLVQDYSISEGFKVSSHLLAESVCAGTTVVYEWTSADAVPWAAIAPSYSRKALVVPGPVRGVVDGQVNAVQLRAYIAGAVAQASTVTVQLRARGAPLEAHLRGPSGDFKTTATIVLNATDSFDPDDRFNTDPFVFSFDCARDDGRPCFGAAGHGNVQGGVWVVPGGLLTLDHNHTFMVTASKGSRYATASLQGIRPRAPSVPTGIIARVCGAPACTQLHSADQPLSLVLRLPAAFAAAAIQWTSDQVALVGSGLNLSSPDLTIPASILPRVGDATIAAQLTLAGQTGIASIAVPLNSAPYCASTASSACLTVTNRTDMFPNADCTATVVNVTDDGGSANLRFEFGLVVNSQPLPFLIDRATSFKFTGLPLGASTIYVRAVDALGASATFTRIVTVKAPPSGFDAIGAVSAIDVSRAAATGDPAALSQAAMAIAALASYGFSSSSSAASASPDFVKGVDAQATAVLAASSASLDAMDPDTVHTTTASAASIVKVMTSMGSPTKLAITNISKTFVASAKVAAKPVPPATASSIVLLLQNGASKGSNVVHGKEQRRTLLSDADLPTSIADQDAWTLGNVTAATADLVDLMALGVSAGGGYVAAGDAGAWISVATASGREIADSRQRAGAAASGATANSAGDALLAFVGPFVGPCTSVDDTGAETAEPCNAGAVTVGAQFFEDSSLFTASATDAGLAIVAQAAGLAGVMPASGVVVLSVSGSDPADGSLPCAPGNLACSVRIGVPLAGATALVGSSAVAPASRRRRLQQLVLNSTAQLVCLRMEDPGAFVGLPPDLSFAITEVVPASADAANGLATCTVMRSGTYMLAAYTRDADANSTYKPPNGSTPYAFRTHFEGMDYDALMGNITLRDAFKANVRVAVAVAAELALASIEVANLTRGSLVADIIVHAPSTWTATQVNTFAATMSSNPAAVFGATFLAAYPEITGITVQVTTPLPPTPSLPATADLNLQQKIAIGVGVGAGVPVVAGVAVSIALYIHRRRRMLVEPRNALGGTASSQLA